MVKRNFLRRAALGAALLGMAIPILVLMGGCDRSNHGPGTTWSDKGTDTLSLPGLGAGAGAGWMSRGGVHPD